MKLGENRLGDNAETCYIELVDYNENMLKTAKPAGAKKRSRRSSGKSEKKAVEPEAKAEDTASTEENA